MSDVSDLIKPLRYLYTLVHPITGAKARQVEQQNVLLPCFERATRQGAFHLLKPRNYFGLCIEIVLMNSSP